MHKFIKTKAIKSNSPDQTSRQSYQEEIDDFDFDEDKYDFKKKVICICPKCGKQHKMSLRWIGRGTPRKYCQPCKNGSDG